MQFIPRDPDLETLVGRIKRGVIDLQPDFQRGEVWSKSKQQRLVDSVLRGWHIPPVHLVARPDGGFDVLDGQQRLTALRDFSQGKFVIDGSIEPSDPQMAELNGLRYEELPTAVRDRYDTFSIRVLELQNYRPEEPHELFFRLNQPTSLTEAEKRNAFAGGARDQVKSLVRGCVEGGMIPERVGFSNSRLAYDDIVARFLLTVEQRTIADKLTAQQVTQRYREPDGFSEETLLLAKDSLERFLGLSILDPHPGKIKPNKATLHTWLCLFAELGASGDLPRMEKELEGCIALIETSRMFKDNVPSNPTGSVLAIFRDRSAARVADVSSVILRDLIAWIVLAGFVDSEVAMAHPAWQLARSALRGVDAEDVERGLLAFAQSAEWGAVGWI